MSTGLAVVEGAEHFGLHVAHAFDEPFLHVQHGSFESVEVFFCGGRGVVRHGDLRGNRSGRAPCAPAFRLYYSRTCPPCPKDCPKNFASAARWLYDGQR